MNRHVENHTVVDGDGREVLLTVAKTVAGAAFIAEITEASKRLEAI